MYQFADYREKMFTDNGQRLFIAVRDRVKSLLKLSGAVRMQEAMKLPASIGAADSWSLMACLDRMVELGDIVEVTPSGCIQQQRVFVDASS